MTTLADLKGQTVAFAASGGLDSCTVTKWLTENGVRVVRFPADGWLCFKVRAGTPSLQERRSVADNDEVQQKLTALLEYLRIEENKVDKVRKGDREAALTPDQRVEPHRAEQDNDAIRKQLAELRGHDGVVASVAFGPGGRLAIRSCIGNENPRRGVGVDKVDRPHLDALWRSLVMTTSRTAR